MRKRRGRAPDPLCRFAEAPPSGRIALGLRRAFLSRRARSLALLAAAPSARALAAIVASGDGPALAAREARALDALWALPALEATLEGLLDPGFDPELEAEAEADLSTLRLLLGLGARPDWLRSPGDWRTPLARACCEGQEELALALLPFSDPNARDGLGLRPLELCARAGSERLILALLDRGARLDSKDALGLGPLERFAAHGRSSAARLLIARGARLSEPDGASADALAAAACAGLEESALILAQAGASLLGRASPRGAAGFFESPALRSAAARVGRFESLVGSTAHWAALQGLPQLIERCRLSGADPDAAAFFLPSRHAQGAVTLSVAPLTLAFIGGSLDCALELLQAGASPRAPRPFLSSLDLSEMTRRAAGGRPPWLAIEPPPRPPLSTERLRELWRLAPEFEPISLDPNCPREIDIIQRCVELGASPSELAPPTADGQDALMIAAAAGSPPQALERLLLLGLDPLRRDNQGMSALDHTLIGSCFPVEAELRSDMFDALASFMAPLAGGPLAIQESIRRLRDRRSPLPKACARWEPVAAALIERQALEIGMAPTPSAAAHARPRRL